VRVCPLTRLGFLIVFYPALVAHGGDCNTRSGLTEIA